MLELYHHGVKGMKWGVRKDNKIYSRDRAKANDIYNTLTDREKYYVTAEKGKKEYTPKGEYEKPFSAYSFIESYKDVPVSVFDAWYNGNDTVNVSIAIRNDKRFRGKGYAHRAVANGKKWLEEHPEIETMVWGVNRENKPSVNLAKKNGFKYVKDESGWTDEYGGVWDIYAYKNPKYRKNR